MLVGPSGCGKTTALRMIAGLEDITLRRPLHRRQARERRARARPRHRDGLPELRAVPAHDRRAEHRLQPASSRSGRSTRSSERVARDGAACSGLEELLDRRPKQLSGGQRQRVAMGRAIIRQPQAFLMDEPLSNLDAQLRVHMRGEIESLQKRLGVTTVYVTHDQVEAMTMGDRVAVLRDGRAAAGRHADERLRPAGEPLRRGLHRLAADEPRARSRSSRRTAASSFRSARRRSRCRAGDCSGLEKWAGRKVDRRVAPGGSARASPRRADRRQGDASAPRSTASRRSARTSSSTSASTHRSRRAQASPQRSARTSRR